MTEIQQKEAAMNLKSKQGCGPYDVLDVTVTCECTWSKEEFTALYGVVVVISWDSGEVLDCEVVSRHCSEFARWDDTGLSSDEYLQWYDRHKDQCTQNFVGSAPAKEAEGVLRIWRRSESCLGMCYTYVISDGNSKAFAALRDARPYGETQVVKHELVRHVQKRVGWYLRDLKKDKTLKDTDGERPKFAHRLTDASIDKLQKYYGNAICANVGKVKAMKRICRAIFYHSCSHDGEPQHEYCPMDPDTWCHIFVQSMKVEICHMLSLLESPQI